MKRNKHSCRQSLVKAKKLLKAQNLLNAQKLLSTRRQVDSCLPFNHHKDLKQGLQMRLVT